MDDVDTAFNAHLIATAAWVVPLILLIAGFALFLANSITRPIAAITDAMRHLAQGDLSVSVPGAGRKDEIGQMADATEVFRDGMLRAQDLSVAQIEEQRVREERARRIEEMTRRFDESATALLTAVTSSAGEMEHNARSMADIAEGTNARSTTVATAAQQAAANVQTVASATEELSSSISEISSQVSKSSQIASQAVGEAQRTDNQIQGLADAAEKIGQVVSMIAAIAEQTNLLALNATIEAARAGEAGRGFAVVAAEVKELASQTSKATEEITSQISAIQSETRIAVGAVQSIGRTVEEMNAIAAAIAAAVEEQGAATGEIARKCGRSLARHPRGDREHSWRLPRGQRDPDRRWRRDQCGLRCEPGRRRPQAGSRKLPRRRARRLITAPHSTDQAAGSNVGGFFCTTADVGSFGDHRQNLRRLPILPLAERETPRYHLPPA